MSDRTPRFEDFLLSEYSNIAEAHFKSIETISTFFRYYLLIMSIPISAIAVFFQIAPDRQQILSIVLRYKIPVSLVLFCISLIGLGVFCYITNLRLDAVLYARVVNGIRKFFYDEYNKDINFKLRMRVLPQNPQLPHYLEKGYFFPVLFVFAVMNTFYISLGSYIIFDDLLKPIPVIIWFILLHVGLYLDYAKYRETSYLRSNILGVDIDGVLNKHREQFCSLLSEKTGKRIEPENITVMPVHEHSTLEITREDERQVFNDPKYWYTMPVFEDAIDNMRKLRNIFKLKIFIFTYRPWPDDPDEEKLLEHIKEFLKKCESCSLKTIF